ncbi:MAG TPA: methionine--tRNA ligase, partial [Synechococcales bacterium UBA8647]|nr:methionine--tRNA ligase [Synechococcales bacterium UBA8647]
DDGDIQQQRLLDLVNNDLANTIGNLVNRSISMARKWFEGVPSLPQELPSNHPLKQAAQAAVADVASHYQELRFHAVAEQALQLAIAANGYLSDQAPWKAIKDPANRDQVAADLYAVLEASRVVGVVLQPLLPEFSERLLQQLNAPSGDWNELLNWGQLTPGPLDAPSPLLQRLELEEPI